DRDQQREGDGDEDDERTSPTPQKEEHHQASEPGGDNGFAEHPLDRALNEDGLVEQRVDLQLWGQRGLDDGQRRTNTGHHVERAGALRLEDGEQRASCTVDRDHAGLRGEAVAYVGDVAHVDHCPIYILEGQIIEPGGTRWASVEDDGVLLEANLGG